MTRNLFGHPPGLAFLFGTEMWERFSYYGMVLLLPLYCLQFLLLPGHHEHVVGFQTMKHALESVYGKLVTAQQFQSAIYGAYTSLVYFTPLVGGFLADRWLGRRYTVVAGGILMAIGHFLMAFENYFYIALLFLILGNGGFKPNISTQVGGLYPPGDHRIDRAYSIFYVGINLGALIGQNICGAFGDRQLWSYGFGAAGVGMLIGTLIYLYALRILPRDKPPKATAAARRPPMRAGDWRAVIMLGLLFVPGCLFWAAWGQSGNTVEVWSVDRVNRVVSLGFTSFTLTVGNIQSFNSIFILAFTPLVIWFWKHQEAKGREPSAAGKMALGFVILALSYFILAGAQAMAGAGQVHWFWTLVYFAVYTVGELYFSPVGLSLYSKAAPPQVAALMMAVFLATSFPGNFIGGWLGTFYSTMSNSRFFLFIGIIALVPAPIIWAFGKPLRPYLEERN
ncbi:MAG TPA: peptide MFS transporter [Rhizomicrobium sp.]|jgi:POT family proton-dependent oligopeptide transporter|nr:peptide MFS transporter [Rhizomicrobium sp.]